MELNEWIKTQGQVIPRRCQRFQQAMMEKDSVFLCVHVNMRVFV